jgi:hypothetical protein
MKCLDGADAGVEVIHKANTDGTIKAVVGVFDLVRNRIDDELRKREQPEYKPDNKIAPIVLLERDSYPHKEFGKTNIPVLTNVGWMSPDGPEPEPAPAEPTPTPPVDQPRRRRVA